MVDFNQAEKLKKEESFQRFFLIAIIFHIVVFFLLNLNKAGRLDLSKEAIIPFGMVKLPPSPEAAASPKEPPPPAKTEVQTKAESAEQKITKAFKEDVEIKPMEVVQPDERDLLRERLSSSVPTDVMPSPMEQLGDASGGSRVDLPAAFGRSDGSIGGSGRETDWGIYSGKGDGAVGTGSGSGDGTGFGKKKAIERYSYGQMALKGLVSRIPDWVEKSNRIIITSIRVWISSEGKVIKAEVSRSSGYLELDQLAVDSIYKREFTPSNDGNVRIAIIEIDFTNIR